MTEKDSKPFDLAEALALEERIADWNDYLGAQLRGYTQDIHEAEMAADMKAAQELGALRSQVMAALQRGYSHAQESEIGRNALKASEEKRRKLEAYIAGLPKKQKE